MAKDDLSYQASPQSFPPDLMVLGFDHPHALSSTEFASVFGDQQPIIFNFHGYNSVIKGLTFDRKNVPDRMSIHGYKEEGTTTTPFRMLAANGKF